MNNTSDGLLHLIINKIKENEDEIQKLQKRKEHAEHACLSLLSNEFVHDPQYDSIMKSLSMFKVLSKEFIFSHHGSLPVLKPISMDYDHEMESDLWHEMEDESLELKYRLKAAENLYTACVCYELWVQEKIQSAHQDYLSERNREKEYLEHEISEYEDKIEVLQTQLSYIDEWSEVYALRACEDARIEQMLFDSHLVSYKTSEHNPLQIYLGIVETLLPYSKQPIKQLIDVKLSDFKVVHEYLPHQKTMIKDGIKSLLIQLLSRFKPFTIHPVVFDPLYSSNARLEELGLFCGRTDAFMRDVCRNEKELKEELDRLLESGKENSQKLKPGETVWEYNANHSEKLPLQMLFIHDFPMMYHGEAKKKILTLLANADQYGILFYITKEKSDHQQKFEIDASIVIESSQTRFTLNEKPFEMVKYTSDFSDELVKNIQDAYKEQKIQIDYHHYFDLTQCNQKKTSSRKGFKIPFGLDTNGKAVEADLFKEKCFAFLSGATGSGKSTLLHSMIAGMLLNYSPDDLDLWLVDFNMKEFSPYFERRIPHVKAIVLENTDEVVFDLIERLTTIFKQRLKWFDDHGYKDISEVPENVYLPRVVVVIDEFSVMSSYITDTVYAEKLEELLKRARAYGFNFIFSNQTYSTGLRGLSDASRNQIKVRFAMMNNDDQEVSATLGIDGHLDSELRHMIHTLPPYQVLYKRLIEVAKDEYDYEIQRLKTFKLDDEEMDLISDTLHQNFIKVKKFDAYNESCYLDKNPILINGAKLKTFDEFEPLADAYEIKLSKLKNKLYEEDDRLIYLGTACKLASATPSVLSNQNDENLLIVGGSSWQRYSIWESAIASFRRESFVFPNEDGEVEIWMHKSSKEAQYSQQYCQKSVGMNKVCQRLDELLDDLRHHRVQNRLIVLLSIEKILKEIENIQWIETKNEDVQDESWDVMDALDKMLAGEQDIPSVSKTEEKKSLTAEEFIEKLNFALQIAPSMGVHFICSVESLKVLQTLDCSVSRFEHKAAYRVSEDDSYSLFSRSNRASALPENIFRYGSGTTTFLLRPHEWSGQMDEEEFLDDSDGIIVA